MKKAPDKIEKYNMDCLKEKLRRLDIAFPKRVKKEELMRLCEENGLVARPPPEFKKVEKLTIVKCSLNRAMNLDPEQMSTFRQEVNKMVVIISRMLRRASLALSYHMTQLVAGGKPFPDLYKENDTYWKNWMRIGTRDVYPDTVSRESFDEIKEYLGNVLDAESTDETVIAKEYPRYFDQVLNFGGHTFKTVVTNNAWVPLYARLARLTKHKLRHMNIKTVTTYAAMKAIRSEEPVPEELPDAVKDYIAEVRNRLYAAKGQRLYDDYGKEEVGFDVMFRFNFWMQQEFEALKQRRIRLMPIFGVGRVHVRFDARTLMFFAKSLLNEKDVAIVELKSLDKLDDHRDPALYMFDDVEDVPTMKKTQTQTVDEWEDYKLRKQKRKDDIEAITKTEKFIEEKAKFDAYTDAQHAVCSTLFKDFVNKKRVKQGWKFDCSVATDGVSISLQYSRTDIVPTAPAKKKQKDDFKESEYDRDLSTNLKLSNEDVIVLGLDPGRNNIAAITYLHVGECQGIRTEKSEFWKLRRGQYYVDSGIKSQNKKQRRRYSELIPRWTDLGGVDIGLSTSSAEDIKAYLKVYDTFAEEWWNLALKRRESWDSLQRYAGKRRVLDKFFSKVKRDIRASFPDHKIRIAYGSAAMTMKATGKGEVAAPVGDTYKACKRIFNGEKEAVDVVSEFRSTMVGWKSGKKKEIVYKKLSLNADNEFRETLHHTSDSKAPFVSKEDETALFAYNERKRCQGKHRRGGGSVTVKSYFQDTEEQGKPTKLRYPEVRGLRFSKEDGMYLDRDREAAMTIGRLRCMELMGLPRPYPFDPRYKFDS